MWQCIQIAVRNQFIVKRIQQNETSSETDFSCFRKIRIKDRNSNGSFKRWLSLNLALALKCAAAKKRLTFHEICPRFCKEI